jgi:hypothetical protein
VEQCTHDLLMSFPVWLEVVAEGSGSSRPFSAGIVGFRDTRSKPSRSRRAPYPCERRVTTVRSDIRGHILFARAITITT